MGTRGVDQEEPLDVLSHRTEVSSTETSQIDEPISESNIASGTLVSQHIDSATDLNDAFLPETEEVCASERPVPRFVGEDGRKHSFI